MTRVDRGISLVELLVCIALLGTIVTFVINLVPASAIGLQKAADVEAAAAYATEALDVAHLQPPASLASPSPIPASGLVDLNATIHLDRSDFHAMRTWYPTGAGPSVFDVVVTMEGPHQSRYSAATRIDLGQ